jgi:Amt family ammonium transporter
MVRAVFCARKGGLKAVKQGIVKSVLALLIGLTLLVHADLLWSQDAAKPESGQPEAKAEAEKNEEPKPDPSGDNTDPGILPDIPKNTKIEIPKENPDPKDVAHNQNVEFGEALLKAIARNRAAVNMMWTLLTGFLVMFMQAGFALVETGLTRAKNVAHTMSMNFMVYGLGMLGFWICGFAFMFGGYNSAALGNAGFLGSDANLLSGEKTIEIFGKPFGLIGYHGFFLAGRAFDTGIMTLFLFQMVFMDTTATIPTGTMAERWKFLPFVIYGFFVSMVIYPVYGNWVWGGGWLSKLGANFGLGHGHVDFAGSSVVHMVGGVTALAGGIIIGARIGKYHKDGTPNALPAHNVPMYILGTFILAFGWFGFNPGSTLAGADLNIGRIATNTMLASGAGAFSAMCYMWIVFKKPDPSFLCNGMLAGLVAITAPCAFVAPWAAVLIGLIAGVLVIWNCLFIERVLKVDDPVGAISVHGANGAWGVLALGLFADGTYGKGWNGTHWYKINDVLRWLPDTFDKLTPEQIKELGLTGVEAKDAVEQGVTGLLYGNSSQFYSECIGVAANFIWVFVVAYVFFWIIEKLIGNRVSAEVELQGLDVPEMGVLGYIHEEPTSPEAHAIHPPAEPRHATAPPNGKRFTVVVSGVEASLLKAIWSGLCQPNDHAPSADFLAVYPYMTTLQGRTFTFRGGDPDTICDALERLLQKSIRGTTVSARLQQPAVPNSEPLPNLV